MAKTRRPFFWKQTIDTDIRWYESFLQGVIGPQVRVDYNSGFERYKQSEHPHPAVLKAWPVHLKRINFSRECLDNAKKSLSKSQYYTLLQALRWHYLQEGASFSLWRQLYAQEPSGLSYTFLEYTMGGYFLDSALRSPFGCNHELPERIPETLYMHHHIVGYPIMDYRNMFANKIFSKKDAALMEKVDRDLRKDDGPWFWGRLDGIYAIRYQAREAYLPTNGIVNNIKDYYEAHGWRPLEFDLVYPYWKNALYNGWHLGSMWSQWWINDADDVVCVNLYIGDCQRGEVKVFILYCPQEYAKDTFAHYRRLHPMGAESGEKLDIPEYEHFKVYPIPPFDYGLPPEVAAFRDRIWKQGHIKY